MKSLVLVVSLVFLVGCGSSSNSDSASVALKSVNNAPLASGSSKEGYYGKSVKWGNHLVSQWWSISYQGKSERFLLKSDGYGVDAEDIGTEYTFDYGVSKDGRTMNRDDGGMIFHIKDSISSNCYNVDLTGDDYETGNRRTINISMCADGV